MLIPILCHLYSYIPKVSPVTLLIQIFFLLIVIYSENVVQEYSTERQKSYENICDGVFLKKLQVATELRKDFIKGFFPVKFVKFI